MGSASELEYHLLLGRDLAYLAASEYDDLNLGVTETKKMVSFSHCSRRCRASPTIASDY
jgi:hypothetical protein